MGIALISTFQSRHTFFFSLLTSVIGLYPPTVCLNCLIYLGYFDRLAINLSATYFSLSMSGDWLVTLIGCLPQTKFVTLGCKLILRMEQPLYTGVWTLLRSLKLAWSNTELERQLSLSPLSVDYSIRSRFRLEERIWSITFMTEQPEADWRKPIRDGTFITWNA